MFVTNLNTMFNSFTLRSADRDTFREMNGFLAELRKMQVELAQEDIR